MKGVDSQQRGWIISGRNLQQEAENNSKNHRNASVAASQPQVSDEGPTIGSTNRNERSVQFENDEDGGASSQFGYNGCKKQRHLGAVKSTHRRMGKAIKVSKPSNYDLRARAEIDT
jgi:hypothetical protein